MVTLALGSGEDSAEAYLLYDNGALDYIVPSSQAIQWATGAWGSGQTLVWEIEDGPDWSLLLDHSAEDFGAYVEKALSVWSAVPTADISWRLGDVRALSNESRFGDTRPSVYFEVVDRFQSSGATVWWNWDPVLGVWEITDCDVAGAYHWAEWLEDGQFDAEDLERWAVSFLVREFGHCLGLNRPAGFPASRRLRTSTAEGDHVWHSTAVWWPFSGMYSAQGSLSEDDRIGASLLRPRAGWLSGTGSLAGLVESNGESLPYVHVYALRLVDGQLRDPVGGFANVKGAFLIEGLPPGDYVLWGHPFSSYAGHRPLVEARATTDLKDTVLATPVRVEAGRTTDGIAMSMQRGRE